MNTRKTFLGRMGSTLGLLILGGPRKLYAALRRPTLTEALADGKWHDVVHVYAPGGFELIVDGRAVRWRVEDQPPNGIARKERQIDAYARTRMVFYNGLWRKEVEHNRTAVERYQRDGYWMSCSLAQDAPVGKVLELWIPHLQ